MILARLLRLALEDLIFQTAPKELPMEWFDYTAACLNASRSVFIIGRLIFIPRELRKFHPKCSVLIFMAILLHKFDEVQTLLLKMRSGFNCIYPLQVQRGAETEPRKR
jgi:hypothetical protein